MYMPDIGRWGVIDPLADDKKLISFSPYSYVRNNPVNLIDPTGMKDEDPDCEDGDCEEDEAGPQDGDVNEDGQIYHWFGGWVTQEQYDNWEKTLYGVNKEGEEKFDGPWYEWFADHNPGGDIMYEINKFNPLAIAVSSITAYTNGTDYYGVPMSKMDATLNLAMIIPIGRIVGAGTKITATAITSISKHGLNQAITRGFKAQDILRIIREGTPQVAQGRYGPQIRYMLGGNTVIVNGTTGKIITAFSSAPGSKNGLGAGHFIPLKN